MPRWIPVEKWLGEDVFIIGGGYSLKKFNFNLLKYERTIGCNTAYMHGSEICKICIFGDAKWFSVFQHQLQNYEGLLFTNAPQLQRTRLPYLWTVPREMQGLHRNALGWNGNTGASAINLALLLGAHRIFLLGFDMQLSDDGRPNWHNRLIQKPDSAAYPKMLEQFEYVTKDLKKKFPGRFVYNVTDNSMLSDRIFPKIETEEFWIERAKL